MIIPKLRNKIYCTLHFVKIPAIIVCFSTFIFSSQISVENAASIFIEHSKNNSFDNQNKLHFHPTEVLNIIAKQGHSLPQNIKNELIELGFDFSGDIVVRGRPEIQDSEYIDSGIFRFHYTLSGGHAVLPEDDDQNGIPDYVELMKQTFDDIAVIDFEQENYSVPPSDGWYTNQNDGGDWRYDVYIYSLEPGYYGFVQAEEYAQNFSELTRGDNENSTEIDEINALVSWMGMRNNYADFPGIESNIIQATSAHEFYHAVQYGYDAWDGAWIKEASAVWMEEVNYDDINDCYQYIPLFFAEPELGPNYETLRMYGSYIYVQYLVDNHFDNSFMKSYWENSVNHDSYEDTDYSIITVKETMDQYNPNFSSSLFDDNQFEKLTNDFLIANALVTNDSIYDPIYHYEEVSNENWPITEPTFKHEIDSLGSEPMLLPNNLVGAFGANYFKVNVSDETLENISVELLSYYPEEGTLYLNIIHNTTISTTHMNEDEQVINVEDTDEIIFFVSAFTYEFDDLYYAIRIVPNSTASTENLSISSNLILPNKPYLINNFPNPFNPFTKLNYVITEKGYVSISILNLLGQNIIELNEGIREQGIHSVPWNGKNYSGTNVETGVYIYNLNFDGNVIDTKKMILLK